jgi:general L-amino acid transport system permease protein
MPADVTAPAPVAMERPPRATTGPVAWIRDNLFSSVGNSILTVLGLFIVYKLLAGILDWAVFTAVFTGTDGKACQGEKTGACWPFIQAKFGQFIYGRYPIEERYRVNWTLLALAAGLVPLLVPAIGGRKWFAAYTFLIFPVIAYWLLTGGAFGMPIVKTELWGGFLVTLVVALVGIVGSFPIGVMLALGRRSKMPIVRWISVGFIEFIRGVPLITILFMASVMLPLFLPDGVTFDKLLRALIGVMLFQGAYMAETIRGGLQAIPRGQFEAADALGLSYPQKMGFIVLPQALKLVIPGIVNSIVGLSKDTSLVLIIGLFDLLGIVQLNLTDTNWFAPSTAMTGYVFAGVLFWILCFSMSRYSAFIERRLARSEHK